MYIYLCNPWKLCMTCSAREVTSQAIAPFRATWPGWRGADDCAQKKPSSIICLSLLDGKSWGIYGYYMANIN